MLISVLYGPTKEDVHNQIRRSLPFAQGFELRLDLLSEQTLNCIDELRKTISIPLIFTFRESSQGGGRVIEEHKRLQILNSFLSLQPDYCDIEVGTDPMWLKKIAQEYPKIDYICSYHNFQETPQDLEGLFAFMQRPECTYYKIAVHANSTLDMLRLMAFAKTKKNLIWISMGPSGMPSRVLSPITGSHLSYCGLENRENALQQIDLQTLIQIYRFSQMNEQTQIFCLIGDPVDASIGHLYHNHAFAQTKKNAIYVKLRVVHNELEAFFRYARQLSFRGLSVTMPHKSAVLPFLDAIDPYAQTIGAVNTIRCENNILTGYNTDGQGALNAIERHIQVQGKRIALLGAGGAARAILYEAIQRGADVHIFNRTFKKAQELAAHFGAEARPFEELSKEKFDVLINTIPSAKDGAFPYSLDKIHFPIYVLDTDVKADETAFSQMAKHSNSVLIFWKEMFYEQAALQQKIWNGSNLV